MLKIIYYTDSQTGTSPIKEDIKSIKKGSIKAKIKATIIHVAQKDGITSYLVIKNIRGYHFSEIRIKFSRDLYRILYFIWQGEKIILLHMFVKREGCKTPIKELNKAEIRYNDFINNTQLYE